MFWNRYEGEIESRACTEMVKLTVLIPHDHAGAAPVLDANVSLHPIDVGPLVRDCNLTKRFDRRYATSFFTPTCRPPLGMLYADRRHYFPAEDTRSSFHPAEPRALTSRAATSCF
jgi:hypothetical protein